MRIIKLLILLSVISYSVKSISQENMKDLTLEDLIPGGNNYSKFKIHFPQQIQWWGDTPLYIENNLIKIVPQKEGLAPHVLLDGSEIDLKIKSSKPLSRFASITFPYAERKVLMLEDQTNVYLYDFDKKEVLTNYSFPSKADSKDFSKETRRFAYTLGNNLFIKDSANEDIQITFDEDSTILNGQSVHRNEFGIQKGTFWSSDGKKLAFYRMDQSMVTDYPLVDISTRIAELKNIKYPMAGMKSHQVTIGIYDTQTNKTIYLKTGLPKEKYLTNIAWSPNGEYINIAELNRGQDTCRLIRYNTITGEKDRVLFTETHPKYVEPEMPMMFVKNNENQFIWLSKKNGYNHAYLYDTDGNQLRSLTSGHWDITNLIGFDASGSFLYFVSTEESPIEKHIYQLNLKTGTRKRISGEEGIHSALLSHSGKYLIDKYTSQFNPGKVSLINIQTKKSNIFFTAKNPYKKNNLPEINLGKLLANDGKTDLYYRLIKPLNFDPEKKYPVIIYVYGGPHSQLVDNSWLGQARGWDIYMAQEGYVVFTLDNRGTNNRGADFENITHRQLGVVETEDQMAGVDFLKKQSFVDVDRIGVHGWSFGGFMTLNMMLRHPEVFKVGVAGGPVTDWKYYEIMYGERYMDSPKENPEGYSQTSMINKAGDLQGRLLLIHGDEDPTVVMQHSLLFLKACIKKGTYPDFFIYPGHGHNMIGHDRVHLHEKITRYFEDFLK